MSLVKEQSWTKARKASKAFPVSHLRLSDLFALSPRNSRYSRYETTIVQ